MNAKKKALLNKEHESHLAKDGEVVSNEEQKRLEVEGKLKKFKLTTKYAETEAYLKKPRKEQAGKQKSVVTVHRRDDTSEQVDPTSLKEIILQSDNIKKITIEKVGIEDAKRVSFHFDDPNLQDKSEKLVIKGESLKKLIKKRSDENKSKLKSNIQEKDHKLNLTNSSKLDAPKIANKNERLKYLGKRKELGSFEKIEEFYETKSSGLAIKFPKGYINEEPTEKDLFDESAAHDLLEGISSHQTGVEDAEFIESNETFSDPTTYLDEQEDEQTTAFEVITDDDAVIEEYQNKDSPRLEVVPTIEEDSIDDITEDNYLSEVINSNQDVESDDEPVLKTVKYKAQILSKDKNVAHNGYYYRAVDHVELFKTGASYLEDFKNGIRSFAFSGLGLDQSKQKSIFGICSFFNYHTQVRTLIVAKDFKKSFFSFYITDLKVKEKAIYKDGQSYRYYQGDGFDILDFQELRRVYTQVAHYDYEEFLRELTNRYDLVLWDLPEMDILDSNKEVYFPVIRMLDNVSLIVKGKQTNVFEVRDLADYYSKYQVDIKGVLFDAGLKPSKKKGAS